MADHLVAVETNSERVIPLSTLGDLAVENARKMFYALTMLLQGPPLLLLKRVERINGFEAWRQPVERYEGANASRLHYMLQSTMRPKAFPQDSGGFEVALDEREHLVQRWEVLATDILNDAVERQIFSVTKAKRSVLLVFGRLTKMMAESLMLRVVLVADQGRCEPVASVKTGARYNPQ